MLIFYYDIWIALVIFEIDVENGLKFFDQGIFEEKCILLRADNRKFNSANTPH